MVPQNDTVMKGRKKSGLKKAVLFSQNELKNED